MGKYTSFGNRTGGFLKNVGGFICIILTLFTLGEFVSGNGIVPQLVGMILITLLISIGGCLLESKYPS
jgi:hypothetical protein